MLKKINETMQVRMTLEEANHINALLDRDKAKAIVRDDKYDLTYCPSCNGVVFGDNTFCSKCGQRLDTENIAL